MGERESRQAAAESRRDLTGRPPTRRGHEDALLRFLGAAAYQHVKATKDEQEQPHAEHGEHDQDEQVEAGQEAAGETTETTENTEDTAERATGAADVDGASTGSG
jgi:hypothetical protein